MRGSKTRIGLVSVAMLCALLPLATTGAPALAAGAEASQKAAAPDSRPNILLLISDDQAWSVFSRDLMPNIYGQLADNGVLMRRAYVNTSLCCPSRAQILTGLYEHNTGVDANEIPLMRPTLPQALHDQGYRTMLAGKYLNSWPCGPRPEFDRWVCTSTPAPSNTALTHPYINVDGVWNQYGGYQPDVLATFATDFITQTPKDQPFFVMYTPTSPHLPADDPRYDDMPVSPPRGGAFNANMMTEGAPRFARRSALNADEIASSDANYVAMAHATRSLDDAMGAVLDSLGDRSRDTLVIFMSDNGFLYGEHRRVGKNDQWEESVNVPMVVRYPAVLSPDQSFVSDALVQNVDIAATIADLLHFPWKADGKSFMPILEHRKALRTAALIEHCSGPSRGTLDCSGLKFDGGRVETPGFHGIVTQRFKYVEFDDGSIQLLDLKKDPHEMHNLARDRAYAHLKQQLAHRMHAMMTSRLDTTIATGPGATLQSRIAGFSYFSPSRFASYRCRLNADGKAAAWHACPGGFEAFGDLADGHYVFQVAGIGENGRPDPTPASRPFNVVSTAGPHIELLSHPAAAQKGSSASFTYSASIPDANFECRLSAWDVDAEWAPCSASGASYSGLAEGSYRFEVRSRDQATGEMSDPGAGWFFRVDTTGPTVAFSSAPLTPTRRDSAMFRFVASERTSGPITCTLDNHSVGCAGDRISLPRVAPGVHRLAITAKDQLGNVGTTEFGWLVDRSAPEVWIASGPAHLSNKRTANFDLGSSVEPGLFICQLDQGPTMPCFTAPSINGVSDGDHTLTVWSLDTAMNRSAPAKYRWEVDATAPQLVILEGPQADLTTTSHMATFKIAVSEPGPLFCSIDGAAFASCNSPKRYTGLAVGSHTFQVYGADHAGNKSAIISRTWTIA